MMFIWKAAFRFLVEGRSQTLFIAAGIAIGISVLIFLNILITGLQRDLVETTVGSAPHLVVTSRREALPGLVSPAQGIIVAGREGTLVDRSRPLQGWSFLLEQLENGGAFTALSPVAEGAAFVSRGEKNLSVLLRGVDLERAAPVYNLDDRLVAGDYRVGKSEVLVGVELARELDVEPGDLVRLGVLGRGRVDSFLVQGVFDLGNQALNASWIFISLEGAQSLLNLEGAVTGLELQVEDVFEAETLARDYARSFGDQEWTSWQEENPDLLNALSSQGLSSYVIQAFVLLAVALGISSVLAVSVMQKSKQIGILKALGISTAGVSRIFLIQGALLGFLGSLLGSLLGGLLLYAFFTFTADESGDPLFPIVFDPRVFLAAIAIATLAGMVAAAIPARRAAGLNTIEVIKNG